VRRPTRVDPIDAQTNGCYPGGAIVARSTHDQRCPSRREFCTCACQTAALLTAGAFAACGGGNGSPTAPSSNVPQLNLVTGEVSGRTISVTIGSGSPLASPGSAARVQTSLGGFLVARTGQESFTALSGTCTHEACGVTGFESNQFVCPCHGSRFATSGGVVNGPATRPLPQFATQFANGVLTFTV
jgi:Rieske Fe-S protein